VCRQQVSSSFFRKDAACESYIMRTENAAVANSIAAAERRIEAIEVLCSIITGQAKAEHEALRAIRSALAAPVRDREDGDRAAPSDISADMLG
jgi:hypothetical protein